MARKLSPAVTKRLHQANLLQHKRLQESETLTFDDLITPRCEKCGADSEPTLFGQECPNCKKEKL
jgi:Zn finger protein HypA/HybF involved in hydrogenase expression